MTRLPRLPSTREIVKLYGLSARSQLSQNFILDQNITDKIVRSASLSRNTPLVIEVGPGPGLLTRSILNAGAAKVVAVEKDSRFIPSLTQLAEASEERLKVIQGDALKISHETILNASGPISPGQSPIHIMGNLPFNVASPLLVQWLHLAAGSKGVFGLGTDVYMTLMFQKEVGERLGARPSTEQRGRLSVMAQALCDVKTVYHVPFTVFVPRPKVDASVVQLKPKHEWAVGASPELKGALYTTLEDILRYFFTKRRKTVGHIVKRLSKEEPGFEALLPALRELLDFNARPGDLTTDQFVKVAQFYHTFKTNKAKVA